VFEKLMQAAERTATGVSRRHFLGRIGRTAAVTAAAISGIAIAGEVQAGRGCPRGTHSSRCSSGRVICCPGGTQCVTSGLSFYCA
jgi:hypothetical protein